MDYQATMKVYYEAWDRCTPEQRTYYRQYWKQYFPNDPTMRPPTDDDSSHDIQMLDQEETRYGKRTFHETEFGRNSTSPPPQQWSSRRKIVEHIPNGLGGTIPVIAIDVDIIEEADQSDPIDTSETKRRSKY
eukprot:TRINITY_DN22580_c0_g1_i1.p1 TRINITY_DN22580_c0_g1~~TRINITY_DN22580_c0_g1_i1.p1  ORF type:complete len:132 (+),score=16.96 TRINITY_DN22580_c0_g1_i1:74-469(+)